MSWRLSGQQAPVWEDEQWAPLPALSADVSADSCVIGLGGSGLTLVEELLARDERVVALDAMDVGAGAAGRNGGFLLAGTYDFYHDAIRRHGHARALGIYRATLAEMQRIAEAAPGTVRPLGSCRIAADEWEVGDCRAQFDAMRADGLDVEWIDGADGTGLYFPHDAAFNPLARCRILATRARAEGARLFARTPVTSIDGTRVVTPGGTVHCGRVFVAVDGGLEVLLPELVGRVRTARLQMLATAPTAETVVRCPMYYREGYEYWQQLPGGQIALGGFRDHGGAGEWTTDAEPSEPVQTALETFLREHLGVKAPITHRWAASAGYTETGLPVIEQVRNGVWALGGYCGTGNVIGALAARGVAAAAVDGDPSGVRLLLGAEWSPEARSPAAITMA
ncbi:MAG: FAD-binding oxidoreductase [Gemmatimonadaceae bacterium]|nr:FAD-binding oxidoreductase [Gemmatimonadaceae bacterium]